MMELASFMTVHRHLRAAVGVVLLWAIAAVLAMPAGGEPAPLPEVHADPALLPEPVAAMRDAILDAARSGDIERMRPVIELNELTPLFAHGRVEDPIRHWRDGSADGTGRDVLDVLIRILEAGYVRIDADTPGELYVWPAFAELPLDRLTAAQTAALHRLLTPGEAAAMAQAGRYIHYRLAIAPDGTWHYFLAGE